MGIQTEKRYLNPVLKHLIQAKCSLVEFAWKAKLGSRRKYFARAARLSRLLNGHDAVGREAQENIKTAIEFFGVAISEEDIFLTRKEYKNRRGLLPQTASNAPPAPQDARVGAPEGVDTQKAGIEP